MKTLFKLTLTIIFLFAFINGKSQSVSPSGSPSTINSSTVNLAYSSTDLLQLQQTTRMIVTALNSLSVAVPSFSNYALESGGNIATYLPYLATIGSNGNTLKKQTDTLNWKLREVRKGVDTVNQSERITKRKLDTLNTTNRAILTQLNNLSKYQDTISYYFVNTSVTFTPASVTYTVNPGIVNCATCTRVYTVNIGAGSYNLLEASVITDNNNFTTYGVYLFSNTVTVTGNNTPLVLSAADSQLMKAAIPCNQLLYGSSTRSMYTANIVTSPYATRIFTGTIGVLAYITSASATTGAPFTILLKFQRRKKG